MGKGLSLDIAMNTREVIKGTDDIGTALEGVSDSLDGVASDGSESVGDLERSFSEAMRNITDESQAAGAEVGQNIADGADAAAESTEGIGDAADSAKVGLGRLTSGGKNLLKGDLGGAAEFVANKLTALGPAGAVAGAVAALGIGVVTDAIQKQKDEADKLAARLNTLYTDAVKAGHDYLDQAAIISEAQDVILNPDRIDEYNKAQEDARKLQVDVNTVLLANAGDQKALNTVIAAAKEKQDAYNASLEGASTKSIAQSSITQLARDVQDLTNRYNDLSDVHQTLADNAAHARDLAEQAAKSERDQIAQTKTAEQDRLEAYAASLGKISRTPVKVKVDDTDVDTSVDKISRRLQAGFVAKVKFVDQFGRRID